MAQPKKKPNLEQILKLVSQLPADEQEKLRAKLNSKSKMERWEALFNKVQSQSKDLPVLSDEEIMADVKEIREELKAERAQGRN